MKFSHEDFAATINEVENYRELCVKEVNQKNVRYKKIFSKYGNR